MASLTSSNHRLEGRACRGLFFVRSAGLYAYSIATIPIVASDQIGRGDSQAGLTGHRHKKDTPSAGHIG
jgi:hypothetical protein